MAVRTTPHPADLFSIYTFFKKNMSKQQLTTLSQRKLQQFDLQYVDKNILCDSNRRVACIGNSDLPYRMDPLPDDRVGAFYAYIIDGVWTPIDINTRNIYKNTDAISNDVCFSFILIKDPSNPNNNFFCQKHEFILGNYFLHNFLDGRLKPYIVKLNVNDSHGKQYKLLVYSDGYKKLDRAVVINSVAFSDKDYNIISIYDVKETEFLEHIGITKKCKWKIEKVSQYEESGRTTIYLNADHTSEDRHLAIYIQYYGGMYPKESSDKYFVNGEPIKKSHEKVIAKQLLKFQDYVKNIEREIDKTYSYKKYNIIF